MLEKQKKQRVKQPSILRCDVHAERLKEVWTRAGKYHRQQ